MSLEGAAPTRPPGAWIIAAAIGGASVVGLVWAIAGRSPPPARSAAPGPPSVFVVQVPTPDPNPPRTTRADEAPVAGPPLAVPAAPAPTEPPIPATVVEPRPAPPSATPPQAPAKPSPINLNTASIEELDLLPGVGKATAQAIVEYRTKHGRFRTVSELDKVPGIGPAKLERLRPLVRVD